MNRTENGQYILLGRFLVGIGLCAVATVMWMTGRFGWRLQEVDADRWVSAGLHVLNDAAGAGLVVASSVMLGMPGWKARIMGVIALICALLLVAYSIVSVYGFMSTRITHLESHNRIVAYQQGAIDWTRKTIINRDLPKSERQMLHDELRKADKELKATLRFIPDAQAAGIAAWFNTTVERVQRALVIVTSGVGQLIKVACLFFGFSFLSYCSKGGPSSNDSSRASAGDGQGGEGGSGGPRLAYRTQSDQVAPFGDARMGSAAITSSPGQLCPSRGGRPPTGGDCTRSGGGKVRPQAEARPAQAEAGPAQAEVRPTRQR